MNREDIISMAREAGIIHPEMVNKTLERFAALVASAEREACAKVCEPQEQHDDPLTAWKIAETIRARGNT
jgi:hypothetical protein